MARLLGVPDHLTAVVYLPVGIPAEEVKGVQKMPFGERAWFNGYKK